MEIDSKYTKYATKVVNGDIVAGEYVKQACRNYLSMLDDDRFIFNPEKVDKVERFISKLTHGKGRFKNQPFILLGWQFHMLCEIFGFYYADDPTKRVRKRVFLEVARKCGKTAFIAAIMLYMLVCDDNESNIACVAPSYKQAMTLYELAEGFIKRLDPKSLLFTRLRDTIKMPKTRAWLRAFASTPDKLDSFNLNAACIDECHEISDSRLYDVLVSGMGNRQQPIIFCATTAGFSKEKWYYRLRESLIDNVSTNNDPSTIAMIYTLDKDDDWTDPKVWQKSVPSLRSSSTPNGTVEYDYMVDQVQQAQNLPSARNGVLTKNLNLWTDALDVWIPSEYLVNCSQKGLRLEDFRGEYAFVGLDLSAVSDLTCMSVMIPKDNKFYFWTYGFLPEETIERSPNSELYKQFIKDGNLIKTSGNVQDLDVILEKIKWVDSIVTIQKVGYDAWGSTQLSVNAQRDGLGNLLEPVSQSIGNFSRGHKMLEKIILGGQCVMEDNPMVRWNFANVTLKEDWNGNIKGSKENRYSDKKIDSYISMTECLLLYLDSPFCDNGLWAMNNEDD